MRLIGVTETGLSLALGAVNVMYGDNVIFGRCDYVGTRRDDREEWVVTLRTRSSHGPGHGRSVRMWGRGGKRMATACWHVHGDFLDALASVSRDDAEVVFSLRESRRCRIADHGWRDVWVGNSYAGEMMSDLCECGEAE